eukprot:NODE_315_length_1909_cov_70.975269_g225_i0.p1 GENE.NODE_315_length_1909_cov_70.975269_g225_i0~~NODE_315_length_1909_cov_70.975269_g225_i0.p1  ORF type:complete len:495 (+),score=100.87 NODE_315_length_1909_cov_70.975269_g225_i0:58-1485(+)
MYLLLRAPSEIFHFQQNRSTKLKIESLTRFRLWTTFLLFFIAFMVLMALQSGAVKWRYSRKPKLWLKNDVKKFFKHQLTLHHQVTRLSPWNQEFLFELTLYRKAASKSRNFGFEIPLKFRVQIQAGLKKETSFFNSKTEERQVDGVLVCPSSTINQTLCPDNVNPVQPTNAATATRPQTLCGVCERITIVHDTFISSPSYDISLQVVNDPEERASHWDLLQDSIAVQTEYVYPNESFTFFTCYFHYGFASVSVAVAGMFWFQHWYHSKWKYWVAEAKLVMVLLGMLSLLNNPLLFLNIYTPYWFFPRLNALFVNTYFTLFMLIILILADMLRSGAVPVRRTLIPKALYASLLWLVGFAAVQTTRSKHIIENDVGILKFLFIILVCGYLLWVLSLIFSLAYQWGKTAIISQHIQLFWLTVVLLPAVIAGQFYLVVQNTTSQPIRVGLFTLYNMYTYVLAHLYSPVKPCEPTDPRIK